MDGVSISFLEPSVNLRIYGHSNNNAFIWTWSLGYMGFYDGGYANNQSIKLSGQCLGLSMDLGYDIEIAKNLALGFQLSLYAGTLTKFEQTDNSGNRSVVLEKEQYEGLYILIRK